MSIELQTGVRRYPSQAKISPEMMTNWQAYVIVACCWPKACDCAGEGFDDVRGQLPRFGILEQESMMVSIEEMSR